MTVTFIFTGIDFYDFICPFSFLFYFRSRRYITLIISCLTAFSNISKSIKNTPLRLVFSALFSVFWECDQTQSIVFDIFGHY